MGSDSDLPIMKDAAQALQYFDIDFNICVSSAHRCPEKTSQLAREARDKGVEAVIAGAGGAAHLPGVIASHTTLPVIGVPIHGSSLAGADSLYSIAQMPRGIPVATVAINGAFNAGLLAVQIMAVNDVNLQQKYHEYRMKLGEGVENKDRLLQEKGVDDYLKEMNR